MKSVPRRSPDDPPLWRDRNQETAMPLTFLVAPSGFKESLSVAQVTDAISEGIRRAIPGARILKAPMVDGGEGTVEALVDATGGTLFRLPVTGPVGKTVESFFGIMGGTGARTAVIEMAAAAGLRLVPRDQRDPTRTTSYGVGELIRAALDAGALLRPIGNTVYLMPPYIVSDDDIAALGLAAQRALELALA